MNQPSLTTVPYLVHLPGVKTPTGELYFWEHADLFPNGIRRCFWISGVTPGETRGNHAHWKESQVIVALSGSLSLEVEDTLGGTMTFQLTSPDMGLFVPPLHWLVVRFSPDSVLLGLSDQAFSEEDYIRDRTYFGSLGQRIQ